MPLNATLVVVGGDVKATEIKLRLPSTIGRGRGTTIVLPHPLVSRQHCELFEADGQLMVRDLGSLNGTFVNNQRVTESPLAPGELLTVGTVTFRAVYDAPGAEEQGTKKAGASDKTVRATNASTLAVPPKPAPQQQAPPDSGPLEFDFDQSSSPIDEDVRVTERLDATATQDKKTAAGAPKTAKSPERPSTEKTPAAGKAADKSARPPKQEEPAEDEPVHSSSDDDLNDFLQSLGDK